jgi:hypothetical protein
MHRILKPIKSPNKLNANTGYVDSDFVKAGNAALAHIAQVVIDPLTMI